MLASSPLACGIAITVSSEMVETSLELSQKPSFVLPTEVIAAREETSVESYKNGKPKVDYIGFDDRQFVIGMARFHGPRCDNGTDDST